MIENQSFRQLPLARRERLSFMSSRLFAPKFSPRALLFEKRVRKSAEEQGSSGHYSESIRPRTGRARSSLCNEMYLLQALAKGSPSLGGISCRFLRTTTYPPVYIRHLQFLPFRRFVARRWTWARSIAGRP